MNAGENIPRRNFMRNVIVIIQYNYFSESFCQQTPKKIKEVSFFFFFFCIIFPIFSSFEGCGSSQAFFSEKSKTFPKFNVVSKNICFYGFFSSGNAANFTVKKPL